MADDLQAFVLDELNGMIDSLDETVTQEDMGRVLLELRDAVRDETWQPTPTAERWKERPHGVREDVDDYSMCLCGSPVAAALHDAEPPRIEDLAPGTTFTAQYRAGAFAGKATRWRRDDYGVVLASTGLRIDQRDIDPSTIRDVTPPAVTE